jgi:hypothetical protein
VCLLHGNYETLPETGLSTFRSICDIKKDQWCGILPWSWPGDSCFTFGALYMQLYSGLRFKFSTPSWSFKWLWIWSWCHSQLHAHSQQIILFDRLVTLYT